MKTGPRPKAAENNANLLPFPNKQPSWKLPIYLPCTLAVPVARTLTIRSAEVLRVHRRVQHSIPQPAVISVKNMKLTLTKPHLHTFLYILSSLLQQFHLFCLTQYQQKRMGRAYCLQQLLPTFPIQAWVGQQTFANTSSGFLSSLKLELFKKHLFLYFIGNKKAYLIGRASASRLEKHAPAAVLCTREASQGKVCTIEKLFWLLLKSLEKVLFSWKNTWWENQVFQSIKYFLEIFKKITFTHIQIIKPLSHRKCHNFAHHWPLSMEDVQHNHQPSHDQQDSDGQSDDQMDEVFISCCSKEEEMINITRWRICSFHFFTFSQKYEKNTCIFIYSPPYRKNSWR